MVVSGVFVSGVKGNVPMQGERQVVKGQCHNGRGVGLSALSGHLWEAANILRGPVDAADFKTYIFPLLFFKRISDVYDEELAYALAASEGDRQFAQFPENRRFQVPDDCHWRLRKVAIDRWLGDQTTTSSALQEPE